MTARRSTTKTILDNNAEATCGRFWSSWEESAGSSSGVYHPTADGTLVHDEREKTLTMCTPDGQHMSQMVFPRGGRERSAGIGVQDRERQQQGQLRHGKLHREQMVQGQVVAQGHAGRAQHLQPQRAVFCGRQAPTVSIR